MRLFTRAEVTLLSLLNYSVLYCMHSTAVLQRNSGTQWPIAAIGFKYTATSQHLQQQSPTHSNSHPHPNPDTPASQTCKTIERQGDKDDKHSSRVIEWLELEGNLKTIKFQVAKLQLTRWNCPGAHSAWPWIPPGMRHPYLQFYPLHLSAWGCLQTFWRCTQFHSLCHW